MRRAAKRDANEKPLVKFARDLGVVWLGSGPFDGWAWFRGLWRLVEVKNPDCEGHKDEYTEGQILLMAKLRERGISWSVWRTETDVLRDIGGRRAA